MMTTLARTVPGDDTVGLLTPPVLIVKEEDSPMGQERECEPALRENLVRLLAVRNARTVGVPVRLLAVRLLACQPFPAAGLARCCHGCWHRTALPAENLGGCWQWNASLPAGKFGTAVGGQLYRMPALP